MFTIILLIVLVGVCVLAMVANLYAQEHVMDDYIAKWEALPKEQQGYTTGISAWLRSRDRTIAMQVPFGALYLYLKRRLWMQ